MRDPSRHFRAVQGIILRVIDWQNAVADGLSPQEVSAGLVTGTIRTSDLPDIATWWLAEGRDSPALRELAGAPTDDVWTLDALWERVGDEIGIPKPGELEAARVDVRRIVSAWQAGRETTSEVLREFDRMALYRFDGLDATAGLLDEIEGGWGRALDAVLVDAETRLRGLIDALGRRPEWSTSQ